MKYADEFDALLEKQIHMAKGQRKEQLRMDKTAEKLLYCEVLRPVMPNFCDWIMEYEMVTTSGVTIYIDFFHPMFLWGIESEGFSAHAQNITRSRFDFEKERIRSMAARGVLYIPFTWDDLNKKPDTCRRSMSEILSERAANPRKAYELLTVYEREVIRYALWLNRPFRMEDVSFCTQRKYEGARNILLSLQQKSLIKSIGKGEQRQHVFVLEEKAREVLFR